MTLQDRADGRREYKGLWVSGLLEGRANVLPIFIKQDLGKRWTATGEGQMIESMKARGSSKGEIQPTGVLHDGPFLWTGWFWVEVLKRTGAALSPE